MKTTRTALAAVICVVCLGMLSTRVRAQDELRNHEPAESVASLQRKDNETYFSRAADEHLPNPPLAEARPSRDSSHDSDREGFSSVDRLTAASIVSFHQGDSLAAHVQMTGKTSARRVVPVEPEAEPREAAELLTDWGTWTKPERLTDSLRLVAVMATLSLAPALLLMTTCYVRIVVVLSLLRQALGSQQLPPNQVTTTLSLFLTLLIMFPVWQQVHEEAIEPYTNPAQEMTAEQAWTAGVKPVREFMSQQIDRQGNRDDVLLFLDYLEATNPSGNPPPQYYSEVPLQALLPAFLLSELKVAFLIGFQVFLPFVIIDLVVSSVTMSMGMVMVPPTTISLPMKLVLFVLADGWHLVVEMLLKSFQYG